MVLSAWISAAYAQKMTVKDSDAHVLMEVNDEGDVGSITLPSGSAPGTPTYKLYNVSGTLWWNGSALGTAGSAGGWTDSDGNVCLTTSGDKVGIGDSSPTNKLDVAGKIGINDIPVIYLPDQTSFQGTLIIGDGGVSLSHSSSTQGWYNTAVGIRALWANTYGYYNTSIGYRTLYSNTTGNDNVAVGLHALYNNSTGVSNTASGSSACFSNTIGYDNTANGFQALYSNIEGDCNTANGYMTLYSNTGSHNTASGYQALYYNAAGGSNSAIGSSALLGNTSGSYNTASGCQALYSNTTASNNTALGFQSLYANTTGEYNTAIGATALGSNTVGHGNTAVGFMANYFNQGGSGNTVIGYSAGQGTSNHNKSGNVFIGYQAGYSETGSNKLYIENSNSSSPLIWGDFTNDRIVINGSSSDNPNSRTLYVNGEAGGDGDWHTDSDGRMKKNVETIPDALEKVLQLRGVNFEWKETEHHEAGLRMGFIAQEAESVIPEVVSSNNDHYSMQYGSITALLVEAVKEQQKTIAEQNVTIQSLMRRIEQLERNIQ